MRFPVRLWRTKLPRHAEPAVRLGSFVQLVPGCILLGLKDGAEKDGFLLQALGSVGLTTLCGTSGVRSSLQRVRRPLPDSATEYGKVVSRYKVDHEAIRFEPANVSIDLFHLDRAPKFAIDMILRRYPTFGRAR